MLEFCCIVANANDEQVYHTHIIVENELGVTPELLLAGVVSKALDDRVDLTSATSLVVEYVMAFTPDILEAYRVARELQTTPPTGGTLH